MRLMSWEPISFDLADRRSLTAQLGDRGFDQDRLRVIETLKRPAVEPQACDRLIRLSSFSTIFSTGLSAPDRREYQSSARADYRVAIRRWFRDGLVIKKIDGRFVNQVIASLGPALSKWTACHARSIQME